jgi:hypothetical protein
VIFNARLQGGPFDGQRRDNITIDEVPERLWVERCKHCGAHWLLDKAPKATVYRRDEEQNGWIVYVFTDPTLGIGSPSDSAKKPEPATA